jgi:3-dehydroquinate synthase
MDPLVFSFDGFATRVVFPDSLDLKGIAAEASTGALFVFDTVTSELFGAGVSPALALPTGETSKSLDGVSRILRAILEAGIGRDGTVIAVGGGVVCDMTAMAASLYMRGCGLELVPTTLLAMVDAAFGGKTGVDFAGYKNMVGTFYPASRVIVATECLASLPEREYFSGLAEAIKTAMIGDAELLSLFEDRRDEVMSRTPAVLSDIVRRCLAVKGSVVTGDFREKGMRAVLNLGHTFGHALESCTGFTGWTHGEAVAWGIGKSLKAGVELGLTKERYAKRIMGILAAYGYRLETDVSVSELIAAMGMDKKKRQGKIRLVVPRGPADVKVVEAEDSLLEKVLSRGGERKAKRRRTP